MTITLKPQLPTVCGGNYDQSCHRGQCVHADKCRDLCAVWAGYFKEERK